MPFVRKRRAEGFGLLRQTARSKLKLMKLILSRKGFDSVAGGCASPTFSDGSFFSLPIPQPPPLPDKSKQVTFSDIRFNHPIGQIVEDLSKGRTNANDVTHFDPDLRRDSLPRKTNWRALFGQAFAAQSHLARHDVGVGDLFLFFGWFREVENIGGVFRYKPGALDRHVFFGWLEVGEVWPLGMDRNNVPDWANMHPHITAEFEPSNTVYVAAEKTSSAGTFPRVTDELVLTCPGANRSFWRLPKWFYPNGKNSCLSYHSSPTRWKVEDDYAYLTSVGRGQEFVLDSNDYPEAEDWVRRLIERNS